MAVELHTGIGFIVHSEPMGNVPSLVLFARNSTRELTSQPYCTQLFSEANLRGVCWKHSSVTAEGPSGPTLHSR